MLGCSVHLCASLLSPAALEDVAHEAFADPVATPTHDDEPDIDSLPVLAGADDLFADVESQHTREASPDAELTDLEADKDSWVQCDRCALWRRPPPGTFDTFAHADATFFCSMVHAECRILKHPRRA